LVCSVWRHWGCVTGRIITNIKAKYSEASDIDGFEDLRPEDQNRVTKALEDGEVAQEDIPDSAKKPDDGKEKEEEKPKKAKRAPKKRKAEDGADEREEKPKKARATSSKVCPYSRVLRISR